MAIERGVHSNKPTSFLDLYVQTSLATNPFESSEAFLNYLRSKLSSNKKQLDELTKAAFEVLSGSSKEDDLNF